MNAGQRRVALLTTASVDETSSIPIDASAHRYHTVYLTSVGTTSAGNVTIEEADWDILGGQPFGGTWSLVGTAVAASTFTGGATIAVHLPAGAYAWLRVRISDAITGGGTVSASLRSA